MGVLYRYTSGTVMSVQERILVGPLEPYMSTGAQRYSSAVYNMTKCAVGVLWWPDLDEIENYAGMIQIKL